MKRDDITRHGRSAWRLRPWLLLAALWSVCCAAMALGPGMYLYTNTASQRYWASVEQPYPLIVTRWSRFLKRYGALAQPVDKTRLLAGLAPATLILPMTVALDEEERQAIRNFAAQGGSLLITGALGSRTATGQDAGLGFLQELTGVQVHGYHPKTDDVFFMPFGDGPVTWPIPAGRRMPMVSAQDSVLRLQAANPASVVMDWARSMDRQPKTVMAFDETAHYRWVLFSFPDTAWPDSPDVQRVLDASLAWLRREPHAFKAAWPWGYQAGHLIEMDTEDKFPAALNLAKHLEDAGYRGTFYSLTSEAARAPEVVRDLLQRGHEIAYHADVHFGFKGDPAGEQDLRMRYMRQQMQSIIGDRVAETSGFRAPTESYDATTEVLLRKNGLLHHAADESATDDRLPVFSTADPSLQPPQALVVLPRTQLDDVSFRSAGYTPQKALETLIHDLDEIVASGGFSLLSVHSQNYVNDGLMYGVMERYMPHVLRYKDRLWVARGDQIAAWWRQRHSVELTQELRKGVLRLRLHTPAAMAGFTSFVTLPFRGAVMRLRSAAAAEQPSVPARVKALDAFRSAVVFDTLPAGNTEVELEFRRP